MQIEESLLTQIQVQQKDNFTLSIWIGNKQSKLIKNGVTIHIGEISVSMDDAIGLVDHKKQNGSKRYRLYYYPRLKKCMKAQKRYLSHQQFNIIEPENQKILEKSLIPQIYNRSNEESTKILICFNPNAGANSRRHLTAILQFISYTNLSYQIFETQHRNHCVEKLKEIHANNQQKQYTAVAIVSGDGLMHEYVNSLCKIPVTHVPAGSGNAFAKTQMSQAGQLCGDWESIFLVIKNNKKQFNIIKYQLEKQQTPVYSFLSLTWGILSDLDINSEFLRFLGGFRFEVYAVWRLISMRRYRGKLTYSRIVSQIPSFQTDLDQDPNYKIIDDTFLNTIFCAIPYISDKYKIAPLLSCEQKVIDLQYLTQQMGRGQLTKYLLNSDSGSHFDLENQTPAQGFNFQYDKIKSFRLEPINPNEMGIFSIDGEAYQAQKIQASFCEETFLAYA